MFDWEAPRKVQEITVDDADEIFVTSSPPRRLSVTSQNLPRGSETLNAVLRQLQDNDLKPGVTRTNSDKMIGRASGHVTSNEHVTGSKHVHWPDSVTENLVAQLL